MSSPLQAVTEGLPQGVAGQSILLLLLTAADSYPEDVTSDFQWMLKGTAVLTAGTVSAWSNLCCYHPHNSLRT